MLRWWERLDSSHGQRGEETLARFIRPSQSPGPLLLHLILLLLLLLLPAATAAPSFFFLPDHPSISSAACSFPYVPSSLPRLYKHIWKPIKMPNWEYLLHMFYVFSPQAKKKKKKNLCKWRCVKVSLFCRVTDPSGKSNIKIFCVISDLLTTMINISFRLYLLRWLWFSSLVWPMNASPIPLFLQAPRCSSHLSPSQSAPICVAAKYPSIRERKSCRYPEPPIKNPHLALHAHTRIFQPTFVCQRLRRRSQHIHMFCCFMIWDLHSGNEICILRGCRQALLIF